jgi:hypothetical protein
MRAPKVVLTAACLALPLMAAAEPAPLRMPSFASLRQHATDSVDINLGWLPLHMLAWVMPDEDADSSEVKKAVQGLKSVQIRSYQFDADFAYPQAEIDALRAQLSQPGWSRVVQLHDRGGKQEDVDIYVALDDHIVKGVAIIACEPREFTVLNIVGSVDLAQIARLRRTFAPPVRKGSQLASNEAL